MCVYVCMCVLCVCVYVCMYARTPIAIFFMYANLTAYDAGPMRPSPCCATNLVGVVHMRSASPKAWGCENKDTLTHHILRSNHIVYSNFPSEPFKEFGQVYAITLTNVYQWNHSWFLSTNLATLCIECTAPAPAQGDNRIR